MQNVCPVCGLPLDLCICKTIDKGIERIKVYIETRRFKKPTTIIEGVSSNAKDVATKLKSKLACGGTVKNDHIELQGDHRGRIRELLKGMGYKEEQMDVDETPVPRGRKK